MGWLREQLAAAANVSVRSRRNAGAAIGLHEIEDQERHRVRIDRRWARARAAASTTSVPVVISLARAGRAAGTVRCCSALRPEACICKIGSGPLRERALRSDAADAIIDERNLLRHTDKIDLGSKIQPSQRHAKTRTTARS